MVVVTVTVKVSTAAGALSVGVDVDGVLARDGILGNLLTVVIRDVLV